MHATLKGMGSRAGVTKSLSGHCPATIQNGFHFCGPGKQHQIEQIQRTKREQIACVHCLKKVQRSCWIIFPTGQHLIICLHQLQVRQGNIVFILDTCPIKIPTVLERAEKELGVMRSPCHTRLLYKHKTFTGFLKNKNQSFFQRETNPYA